MHMDSTSLLCGHVLEPFSCLPDEFPQLSTTDSVLGNSEDVVPIDSPADHYRSKTAPFSSLSSVCSVVNQFTQNGGDVTLSTETVNILNDKLLQMSPYWRASSSNGAVDPQTIFVPSENLPSPLVSIMEQNRKDEAVKTSSPWTSSHCMALEATPLLSPKQAVLSLPDQDMSFSDLKECQETLPLEGEITLEVLRSSFLRAPTPIQQQFLQLLKSASLLTSPSFCDSPTNELPPSLFCSTHLDPVIETDIDCTGIADMSSNRRPKRSTRSRCNTAPATLKHLQPSKKFLCRQCNQTFARMDGFRRHYNNLHSNTSLIPCAYKNCSSTFKRKDNYQTHLKKYHGNYRSSLA